MQIEFTLKPVSMRFHYGLQEWLTADDPRIVAQELEEKSWRDSLSLADRAKFDVWTGCAS